VITAASFDTTHPGNKKKGHAFAWPFHLSEFTP